MATSYHPVWVLTILNLPSQKVWDWSTWLGPTDAQVKPVRPLSDRPGPWRWTRIAVPWLRGWPRDPLGSSSDPATWVAMGQKDEQKDEQKKHKRYI